MRIGITGGIGAGKSYVSHLLTESYQIPVYDCDREAKRLMTASPAIRKELTALVGTEAYHYDGTLNKPLLAQYVFADEANANKVNAIVHPVVKADFLRWAEEQEQSGKKIVAVESAILIEAGLTPILNKVLVVDAPKDLRLQRAMQRDTSSPELIQQRMALQESGESYLQHADFVIINDGRDLKEQLEEIIQSITHNYA